MEDFEDDPTSVADLNKIEYAGKCLLKMISEILDLAKLDAGRMQVHVQPIRFSELQNHLKARENDLITPNNNTLIFEDQLQETLFHSDIFNTFEQVDNSSTREHNGIGLGFKLAHEIALLIQGQLNLESTLGEGSVFTLRLPVQVTTE